MDEQIFKLGLYVTINLIKNTKYDNNLTIHLLYMWHPATFKGERLVA